MSGLHETLMSSLDKYLSDPHAIEQVVAIALRNRIPELEWKDATVAAKQLIEHGTTTVSLGGLFPDEGRNILLTAGELDAAYEAYMRRLGKAISNAATETIDELVPHVVADMRERAPEVLNELVKDQAAFSESLCAVWGTPFAQLELLLNAAREANTSFQEAVLRHSEGDKSIRTFALVRLHLRACRTAHEILALLRAGCADGASARWRSLHELGTVSMFLSERGEGVSRRFIDHQVIEQRKSLREYQRHNYSLAEDPIDPDDAEKIEKAAMKMIRRHGPAFGTDYGWAAEVLKSKHVTFKDIEKSLNLDYWRPYYLLSCQSIHAGSRGCVYSLGSIDDVSIACGPSIQGLYDPGSNCAHSLVLASAALLTSRPILDTVAMAQVLTRLADDAVLAFSESDRFLAEHLIEVPDEFIAAPN